MSSAEAAMRSKWKTGGEFLSDSPFLASQREVSGSCVHFGCDVVRLRAFRTIMQHPNHHLARLSR
jgi:hypothetical protein